MATEKQYMESDISSLRQKIRSYVEELDSMVSNTNTMTEELN
jgi:hypothetical protein